MTKPNLADFRTPSIRNVIRLPAEQLESLVINLLERLGIAKLTLSNAELGASDTKLLVTETTRGVEIEMCQYLGEVKPVRIRQTEMDHLPAGDQFPVVSGVDLGWDV
jgi:hypothetical protein